MELVYPPVLVAARTSFMGLRLKFVEKGTENVPRTGGAVLASNHVSYLDFIFVGLAAQPADRLVRFMAKDSVFKSPWSGWLMRGMKHIPVDRTAGADAYGSALDALRGGEVVGIFPEATISRSFRPKDFKSGAARLAAEAGVPLVPMVTWGSQQLYTKGRKPSPTTGITISLNVGEPLHPTLDDDPDEVTAELRRRIEALLDDTLATYPARPAPGAWWWPVDDGGAAPTREQAAKWEAEEAAARQAKRAARQAEAAARDTAQGAGGDQGHSAG